MSASVETEIDPEDIHHLLDHFSRTTHKAKDGDVKGDTIMEKCLLLFGKDYQYSIITNFSGELCGHYPSKLVLLEYQRSEGCSRTSTEHVQSMYDPTQWRDLFKQARFARCRSRFIVPVMLFEGKHICRSATLSGGAEMYGRTGFDFLFAAPESLPNGERPVEPVDGQVFDRYRGQDIKLMKRLSLGFICDLMVEKKKVKFGMNITSSEKVDKENRYSDFCILSMPYPGCEFFKEWKDNAYFGENMLFDWSQGYVDACLEIPETPLLAQLEIDWNKYKQWDLIQLTQNYLRIILHILKEGDSGVLIHCISGWDRTPMFASVVRLSLWADGAIHPNLNATEILYLTLAYDWYLFGHNLTDRLSKGEEILFFCFNFLRYIKTEEFSVCSKRSRTRKPSKVDSEANMDVGVLLDTEQNRLSYCGSNNSISSLGGASVDNAPVFFTNHQDDDGVFVGNSSPHCTVMSNGRSPVSRGSLQSDGSLQFQHGHFSPSSPMSVPSFKKYSESHRASSPGCGSWQVISSCGSLRGSVSSRESPHSHGSQSTSGSSHPSSEPEVAEPLRAEKLDTVRRIFHNAYVNRITRKSYSEESGGGLSSLMGQFAEKVGIKSGKASAV